MTHYPPSFTEKKFLHELKRIGLGPKAQMPIWGTRYIVDIGFPDVKFYVEVNGPHHRKRETVEYDEKRRAILQEKGWTSRSFTENEIDHQLAGSALEVKRIYLKKKNHELNEKEKRLNAKPTEKPAILNALFDWSVKQIK